MAKAKGMSDKQQKFIDNKLLAIANEINKAIEEGTAPWRRPWNAGEHPQVPHNPITGNTYTGINNLWLSMQGRQDPRWLTENNIKKNDWSIKEGEYRNSNIVQKWTYGYEINKKEKGKVVLDDEGKPEKIFIAYESARCKLFYVYNAEQVNGIPEYEHDNAQSTPEWERHENAEKILANSGVPLRHLNGERAYYNSGVDEITMPEKGQFDTSDNYYTVAMHELGHSTGHHTRLDRKLGNPKGSQDYFKEEVFAEISAYLINTELQLGHDPDQHTSYVAGYLEAIKNEPMFIFKAIATADKIAKYNLNFLNQESNNLVPTHNINIESEETPESEVNMTTGDKGDLEENEVKMIREEEMQHRLEGLSQEEIEALDKSGNHEASQNELDEQHKWLAEEEKKHANKSVHVKNIDTPVADRFLNLGIFNNDPINGQTYIALGENNENKSIIDLPQEQLTTLGNTVYSFKNITTLKADDLSSDDIEKNIETIIDKGINDGVVIVKDNKPTTVVNISGEEFKSINKLIQSLDNKVFMNVPFSESGEAKSNGAAWSGDSWFYPKNAKNAQVFNKWENNNNIDTPSNQFTAFIEEHGGLLKGAPKLDGKIHRIESTLGKSHNTDFAYKGFDDGIVAGWVKDYHDSDQTYNFKADMGKDKLSDADKKELRKQSEAKKEERKKVLNKLHLDKAEESKKYTDSLPSLSNQDYHETKKLPFDSVSNIKQTPLGGLVLPLVDAEGKQWSHTTIQKNGFKQLLKDGKLKGTFFVVGADKLDEDPKAIMLAEGYSTAAAINACTNTPVISVTHSGNLKPVAESLAEKHPNARFYIFADDDKPLELKPNGKNVGVIKAKEAAKAIGGCVIKPVFSEKEISSERTDFHDMYKLRGLKTVREHISKEVKTFRAKENMTIRDQHTKEQQEDATLSQKQQGVER